MAATTRSQQWGTVMHIIRLPDTGAATDEAEVVVWLKTPGDQVMTGETLLEVQSDKANVEIESTSTGVLARVLVPEGELCRPGDPLAVIVAADEAVDDASLDEALRQPDEATG
jgi:pyruvate dehydrogenase E2 component (dihydrolipoamide acetyltransferase)